MTHQPPKSVAFSSLGRRPRRVLTAESRQKVTLVKALSMAQARLQTTHQPPKSVAFGNLGRRLRRVLTAKSKQKETLVKALSVAQARLQTTHQPPKGDAFGSLSNNSKQSLTAESRKISIEEKLFRWLRKDFGQPISHWKDVFSVFK